MLASPSPIAPLTASRSPNTTGRTPLAPKNTPSNSKPKPNPDKFTPICYANKENNLDYASPSISPLSATANAKPEVEIESIDASLADQLNAVRKRLERLRLDRENTERMLRERDRIFEIRMEELVQRGEFQKEFEIEVDRLYRLKQLHLQCMRMSPIRSLREREMHKRPKESPSQSESSLIKDESADRSVTSTPSSKSESKSDVHSAIKPFDYSALS